MDNTIGWHFPVYLHFSMFLGSKMLAERFSQNMFFVFYFADFLIFEYVFY